MDAAIKFGAGRTGVKIRRRQAISPADDRRSLLLAILSSDERPELAGKAIFEIIRD